MTRVSVRDLHATIPVDILEEFRHLALEIHPKLATGAISRELAKAMKAHSQKMRIHTQNTKLAKLEQERQKEDWHVITLKSRPITRIDRKYRMVIAYLERESKYKIKLRADEEGVPSTAVIPEKIWREAIQYVVGLDERTIDKWTRLFINLKFVALCPSAGLGLPNKYMISAAEYHLTEADLEQHKDNGKWLIEVSSIRR